MTTNTSTHSREDVMRLLDFELKQHDYFIHLALESRRLATDFSKLILSSLIAINSGGIVALPALAVFLDLRTTEQKLSVFVWPGACYIIGLLLALLSALIAYFNFNSISKEEMRNCSAAIIEFRSQSSKILGASDAEREALQREMLMANKLTDPSAKVIMRTHVGAHVFAWISLVCFIFGGVFLLFRHGV